MEQTLYFVVCKEWAGDECNWFDNIEDAKEYIQEMLEDEDGSDAFFNKYYIYEGTAKMTAYIPTPKAVFERI